jgi:DNA polymerase-3 subunit epsilon
VIAASLAIVPPARDIGAMREIVFDTETTGLDCLRGDRLVEIGCVEIINRIPTGRTFHTYVNPRRPVAPEAVLVHGLNDAFLRDKPFFEDVAEMFADFVADATLVAHNATFDCGFINMELGLCRRALIEEHRFVDTLQLARRRHPNGPNSLDALCARYGIDRSARVRHGALLDAELLAEVYIELLGGRQATLSLAAVPLAAATLIAERGVRPRAEPLPPRIDAAEIAAHRAYVAGLGKSVLWDRYASPPGA